MGQGEQRAYTKVEVGGGIRDSARKGRGRINSGFVKAEPRRRERI